MCRILVEAAGDTAMNKETKISISAEYQGEKGNMDNKLDK